MRLAHCRTMHDDPRIQLAQMLARRRPSGALARLSVLGVVGVLVMVGSRSPGSGDRAAAAVAPGPVDADQADPIEFAAADDSAIDAYELTETGWLVRVAPAANGVAMPVHGVTVDQLVNTFGEPRSNERRHVGIDIGAPRGTPVVAAVDGWIVSLGYNAAGGRGVHLLDRSGQHLLYYAHLDSYADGLWPGLAVRRRELLGYVGSTGNAALPHLHLEVGRVRTPGRLDVEPINPYIFLTGGT
jgi:peptidoglycan LD-endopeptidase LytH